MEVIDSVCAYCGVGCDIAAHVDVKENKIKLNPETSKFINNLVVQEYINESQGRTA